MNERYDLREIFVRKSMECVKLFATYEIDSNNRHSSLSTNIGQRYFEPNIHPYFD